MFDCMHICIGIILIYYDIIWIPEACVTSQDLTVVYMPCFSQIPNLPYYSLYWRW